MRPHTTLLICGVLAALLATSCRSTSPPPESSENEAPRPPESTLVVIDCSTGRTTMHGPVSPSTPLPPCSTFKIMNALIGIEEGILTSPDQPFYPWDGVERSIPAWNKDLTLREAFQVSCVPAFQMLARQIGPERMQQWIAKTGYGNQDISAGTDVFWLPSKGRRTILITPLEQAELMRKLVARELPFSQQSLAALKDLMFIRESDKGRLYGKTGSGTDEHGTYVLGWFVGYVESPGGAHAFACIAQGNNIMGKDARAIVESFLAEEGWL